MQYVVNYKTYFALKRISMIDVLCNDPSYSFLCLSTYNLTQVVTKTNFG